MPERRVLFSGKPHFSGKLHFSGCPFSVHPRGHLRLAAMSAELQPEDHATSCAETPKDTKTTKATKKLSGLQLWKDFFQQCVIENKQFSELGLARAALYGFYLAMLATTGVFLILTQWQPLFGSHLAFMATFHLFEFLFVAVFHPDDLTTDSFFIYHSKEFTIANSCAVSEFWLEYFFFPSLKRFTWISMIGIVICIIGQAMRTVAMLTAGRNFTLLIAERKKSQHTLVTTGVYSICRHPAYCGWFWWSIGTQIVLQNPVCVVLYAIASWCFFHDRIPYEESTLLGFFGEDYAQYKKRVSTLIPFIP